jgi:hypothetical protein
LDFTTIRLLVAVGLTIATSFAPAGALGRDRAVRLGGGVTPALAEPLSDDAGTEPASCPYRFDSDMPAATFCVYRGVARGGGGEVCATDAVVIWSSFSEAASGSNREIYLAFVAAPELVLRAVVDSRWSDRAEMVGFTLGDDESPQPLEGRTTLRMLRPGSADVLSMDLREPQGFPPAICPLASYSGTFVGMIGR